MRRRHFIKSTAITAVAGVAAANLTEPTAQTQTGKKKYHLRYAPHLSILSKEMSIPQRLDLIAEHGFDATEYNGLLGHPLNEVEEIRRSSTAQASRWVFSWPIREGGKRLAWWTQNSMRRFWMK
ncbi:MAG: hypothetical protein WKF84_29945 [Pyrinomonadaceae bacterium]